MSVALLYNLTDICGDARPFCVPCINSFSLTSCNPSCTGGPSEICLTPKSRRIGGFRICNNPLDFDDPDAILPIALILNFAERGVELFFDNTPTYPTHPYPPCQPPQFDIPLFLKDSVSQIDGIVPTVVDRLNEGGWVCYESARFQWDNSSQPSCFTGTVSIAYYVIFAPTTDNPFEDVSYLGCGTRQIVLTLHGDGQSSSLGFPCGGGVGGGLWTDNEIPADVSGIEWMTTLSSYMTLPTMWNGFDNCFSTSNQPDLPYYGWLLGLGYTQVWTVYGYIPFTLRVPE